METQEEYKVNIRDKQKEIIEHYGFEHQLGRLVEESAELVQAICKWRREGKSDSCIDNLLILIEELADVKNLIEQIELDSIFMKEGVAKIRDYKVNREIDRINRG